MKGIKIAGILILIFLIWWFRLYYVIFYPASSVEAVQSVDTSVEPSQEYIEEPEFTITDRKGRSVKIIPVASYDIQARAAINRSYPNYFNVVELEDVLANDMALVWGKFADKNIMKKVSFSHQWTYSGFSFRDEELSQDPGLDYLSKHFSSNHTVAANKNIDHALRRVGKYDRIRMKGYLINMEIPGLLLIKTSLVRTDNWVPGEGNRGGSEFIYVTELQIEGRVYR